MKVLLYSAIFLCGLSCETKSKYRKAAEEITERMPEVKNVNVGKENYTLYIPEGWTTVTKTAYGIDYYILGAPKTPTDPNTNINVMTEYMYHLSLDEYRAKAIESLKKAVPSVYVFDKGDIDANGVKGAWYSYTMEPAGVKASLVSYIFPRDSIAYIITGGTQLEDAIRYRSTFDSVARSLRFKE